MEDHYSNKIEQQVTSPVPNVMDGNLQSNGMDIELQQLRNLFQNCHDIQRYEEHLLHSISELQQVKRLMEGCLSHEIHSWDDMDKSFEKIKPFLSSWIKFENLLLEVFKSEESAKELFKRYKEYPAIQKDLENTKESLDKKEKELSESTLAHERDKEKKAREECQNKLDKANSDLQIAIHEKTIVEKKLHQSQVEIEKLQEEKNRLSNENVSMKEQLDTTIKKYREKDEIASHLQEEINFYKIFRGLIADAFKIDANSEKEFSLALQTTKRILIACVEYTRDKQYDIVEGFEDLIINFNQLQNQKNENDKLKADLTLSQQKIKEKDSKLFEYELKDKRLCVELESCKNEIRNKDEKIKNIEENKDLIYKQYQELISKSALSSRIISCFTSLDNDLKTKVDAVLNEGNQYNDLNFISDFIKQIVAKRDRLVEIDKIAQQHDWSELSSILLQQILEKYFAFDLLKQNHDLYEYFIKELFFHQGEMNIISLEKEQKMKVLNSFIHDFDRLLALCHCFDASGDTDDFSLDSWEAHQTQMNSAVDDFYQFASKSMTDLSKSSGVTMFEKISLLPSVQNKINQAIGAAIFSINYSSKEVEESSKAQATVHELQLKLEKLTHVLDILETKLYPKFLTSGIEGRQDKLIQDIEAGLEIENPNALALKSYLGLLRFVESSPDEISPESLKWILQKLPISLYSYYQDMVLDDNNDQKIYETMQLLMKKINKNILHGDFFLGMPRLGEGIDLESMELDTDEQPNIVHAVISWKISNSKHQIICKALVK